MGANESRFHGHGHSQAGASVALFEEKLNERHDSIRRDMPEMRNWKWTVGFSDSTGHARPAKGHRAKAMFTDSQATNEESSPGDSGETSTAQAASKETEEDPDEVANADGHCKSSLRG
jgi:hypothetical protein